MTFCKRESVKFFCQIEKTVIAFFATFSAKSLAKLEWTFCCSRSRQPILHIDDWLMLELFPLRKRFPSTRLGRIARAKTRQEALDYCSIFYDKKVPEFFFDRNPENFSSILGESTLTNFSNHLNAIQTSFYSMVKLVHLQRNLA